MAWNWGRDQFSLIGVATILLALSACAETEFVVQTAKHFSGTAEPSKQPKSSNYKIGKPYNIKGVWYYPKVDYEHNETGIASWYGKAFHGKATANGEVYDMNTLTAAHRTLPMPSFVRVTNLENGRSLILRVNDRGPFAHNRIIDVSRRGAQLLGFYRQGTARVRVEILATESRAIAARLTGRRQIAAVQSPIKVKKLPKAPVSSENLAPPPGGAVSKEPIPATHQIRLRKPVQKTEFNNVHLSQPKLGLVEKSPVKPTKMYVQAGAFSYYNNANQVKARLHHLGVVRIYPVLVNGQDLYRVRLGPYRKIEDADRFLESVIGAGYTNARIVIE